MKKLENALKEWIVKNEFVDATRIYSDGWGYEYNRNTKKWDSWEDKATNYCQYVNDDTLAIISEGPIYDMLNYFIYPLHEAEFRKIFDDHGYYFEMGSAISLVAVED